MATGGNAVGDIGAMGGLIRAGGITFLVGGLLFGIALFRAGILARWTAVLLAVGAVATLAIPLLPQINQRLFAIPTSVALIGLGYSLWREQSSYGDGSGPLHVDQVLDDLEVCNVVSQ